MENGKDDDDEVILDDMALSRIEDAEQDEGATGEPRGDAEMHEDAPQGDDDDDDTHAWEVDFDDDPPEGAACVPLAATEEAAADIGEGKEEEEEEEDEREEDPARVAEGREAVREEDTGKEEDGADEAVGKEAVEREAAGSEMAAADPGEPSRFSLQPFSPHAPLPPQLLSTPVPLLPSSLVCHSASPIWSFASPSQQNVLFVGYPCCMIPPLCNCRP